MDRSTQILRVGQAPFSEPYEPVQIGARDVQTSGSQRLVPVVLPHRRDGQLDLVVTNLTLERTVRMVIGDADNVFFLDFPGQVLHSNAGIAGNDDGALNYIFQLAHVAGPGVACRTAIAACSMYSIGFWYISEYWRRKCIAIVGISSACS